MSIRPDERISFKISELSREQQQGTQQRRRGQDDFALRTAAAAAGVVRDVEAANDADEVKREAPPKLRSRRTFCTLLGLWTVFTICFAVVFLFQALSSRLDSASVDEALERRLARDSSIKDKVTFGVWDSRTSITQLQLQVAISMALGVRADYCDITSHVEDNHFFEIEVDHATVEEVEYIASSGFLERLNVHMAQFNGLGVLSKPPRLKKI